MARQQTGAVLYHHSAQCSCCWCSLPLFFFFDAQDRNCLILIINNLLIIRRGERKNRYLHPVAHDQIKQSSQGQTGMLSSLGRGSWRLSALQGQTTHVQGNRAKAKTQSCAAAAAVLPCQS